MITAAATATQTPNHGAIALRCSRMNAPYAPSPYQAACPTEYCPAKPPMTFQLSPSAMAMKSRMKMCSA